MNGPERESDIYLAHISREHVGLRRRLLEMAAALSELVRNPKLAASVEKQLAELEQFLQEHFAGEEDGGALVEAPHYCPSVGREVDRIFAEHRELLVDVRAIREKLRAARPLQPHVAADLEADFDRFRLRMERHEQAENSVVAQAFGTIPD